MGMRFVLLIMAIFVTNSYASITLPLDDEVDDLDPTPISVNTSPPKNQCFLGTLKRMVVRPILDFKNESAEYWKKELDNTLLRERKLTPSSAARCVGTVGKNALKVCFAPTFLIADTLKSPVAAIQRMRSGKTNTLRLLFIPFDLINRNGLHLAGYAAMTAMKQNIPIKLMKNFTSMTDLDEKRSPTVPLKDDELVVFIKPAGAEKLANQSLAGIRYEYENEGKGNHIVELVGIDSKTLLQQLGELRKKGRIKDIHWLAHGNSGQFDMNSRGLGDFVHPIDEIFNQKGVLDTKKLKQLKPITDQWPSDLMADDPRITLYSCDVASGPNGEKFIKTLESVVLKDSGTIFAPARGLNTTYDARGFVNELERVSERPKDSNELAEGALAHFVFLPLISLEENFGIDQAYSYISNGFKPEPAVKVFHLKPKVKR